MSEKIKTSRTMCIFVAICAQDESNKNQYSVIIHCVRKINECMPNTILLHYILKNCVFKVYSTCPCSNSWICVMLCHVRSRASKCCNPCFH